MSGKLQVGRLDAYLAQIKQAAERAGFSLNASKEEGPSASISAFNIELSHQSLAIAPERWAEFAKAFKASESEHQKHGILGYISSVNGDQGAELMALAVSSP